jgi:PGF-pre-PGF domain-containing protein
MDRTAISAVTLTAADQGVKDALVTVAKGSLPRDAEAPAGAVYQYVEATLYRAAAEDFSSIQFRFTVPTTWLAEHGCTAEEIGLLRHTADGWQAVPVEVLGEENGNAVFSASPEGFSLFAIAVTEKVPGVTDDTTPEPTGTEVPAETVTTDVPTDTTPATPQPTPLPVWVAILALGVLLFVRRT